MDFSNYDRKETQRGSGEPDNLWHKLSRECELVQSAPAAALAAARDEVMQHPERLVANAAMGLVAGGGLAAIAKTLI